MASLHQPDAVPQDVRAQFEARVTLAEGEALLLLLDTTAFGSGKEGIALTNRRMVRYYKKRSLDIHFDDIEKVEVESKKDDHDIKIAFKREMAGLDKSVPMLSVDTVELGERNLTLCVITLPETDLRGFVAKLASQVGSEEPSQGSVGESAAVRALSEREPAGTAVERGNASAAESSAEEAEPEKPAKVVMVTDDYRLFHTIPGGRGADVKMLAMLIVGVPIVALAFRCGASMESSWAAFFLLVFWAFLVAGPIAIIWALVNVLRPGERQLVYGVNSLHVLQKLLRGKNHALWTATHCSSSVEADGLSDDLWERAKIEVEDRGDALKLVYSPGSMMGGKGVPRDKLIRRSELSAPADFEELKKILLG